MNDTTDFFIFICRYLHKCVQTRAKTLEYILDFITKRYEKKRDLESS